VFILCAASHTVALADHFDMLQRRSRFALRKPWLPAAKFTVHWAYLRPDYPFMASSEVEFILGQHASKLELPDDFQEKPPVSNFKENTFAFATCKIQSV